MKDKKDLIFKILIIIPAIAALIFCIIAFEFFKWNGFTIKRYCLENVFGSFGMPGYENKDHIG